MVNAKLGATWREEKKIKKSKITPSQVKAQTSCFQMNPFSECPGIWIPTVLQQIFFVELPLHFESMYFFGGHESFSSYPFKSYSIKILIKIFTQDEDSN